MRFATTLIILCVVPLLVCCVDIDRDRKLPTLGVTPIREDDCKERVVPPRMEGVCGPEERNRHCFVYNPVPSCICYMNGTCVNGEADRCSDCSNEEIFSIYDGKCKEATLAHAEDICQPFARDVRCFAYIPEVSCVCYFNGTCLTETIDKCSSCTNDDIVSVTTGCCATTLEAIPIEPLPIKPFPIKPLPIEPIPIEDCRRTPLEKCPYLNPALVLCANHMTEGCICYNDGTCKEGLVNQCLNCMEDGVYAVEEGSKCPCPGVQTFQY